MKKIAIYDVDYTIISTNSLLDVVAFLFKKRPFKIFYLPFLLFITLFSLFRIISLDRLKAIWLLLFSKMSKDEIDKFSKEFIQRIIVPKIKKGAIDNLKDNKKNGYLILFATASFEFYMKYLAEYLNADYCIGTKVLFESGKLKAKLEGKNCKGKEKISRILKVISKDEIDKKKSVAYSDSRTDLPFLELVDTFYKMKRLDWNVLNVIKQ